MDVAGQWELLGDLGGLPSFTCQLLLWAVGLQVERGSGLLEGLSLPSPCAPTPG